MAKYTVNHDKLDAKAQSLNVRYMGGGTFLVASGSRRGIEHLVDADPRGTGRAVAVEEWQCSCEWSTAGDYGPPGSGRMCSHVRAASMMIDRAMHLRKLARYAAPTYAREEVRV